MAISPIGGEVKTLQYTPPPQATKRNDPAERAREAEERKRQQETPPAQEDYLGSKIDLQV